MIVKPENMDFSNENFTMILYGSPGVGKTTLALSSPNPLLIDFDHGMRRVNANHRKDSIFCATYEEVLKDIQSPEARDYETIVVDTGGSFGTYLQDWAMRTNPAVNRQKNGAISLKGYGAVKAEAIRFTNFVRDTLHKNLIYVFHSQENADKDGNATQRLLSEGAFKNIVWNYCDFGGFVQMIGTQRAVFFTPEQEFFAKGCHGIKGRMDVPELGPATPNDFITNIFEKAKANIAADAAAYAPINEQYNRVMETVRQMLATVKDAESANQVRADILSLAHASTSKTESSKMLKETAAKLGLVYSNSAGGFIKKEG